MTEDFGYREVGLSRQLVAADAGSTEVWPAGYRRVFHRIRVGYGEQVFSRLAAGILHWDIQRKAGLRPVSDGDASIGVKVVCGFGWGPFRLPVPCQVVWSENSERFAGFGYGTLPGHPAKGEEAFVAEMTDDGEVYFSVLAFSTPAPGIYTLGAPVSRIIQGLVTKRYLKAARELAA